MSLVTVGGGTTRVGCAVDTIETPLQVRDTPLAGAVPVATCYVN